MYFILAYFLLVCTLNIAWYTNTFEIFNMKKSLTYCFVDFLMRVNYFIDNNIFTT